jgi:hypothetical protein
MFGAFFGWSDGKSDREDKRFASLVNASFPNLEAWLIKSAVRRWWPPECMMIESRLGKLPVKGGWQTEGRNQQRKNSRNAAKRMERNLKAGEKRKSYSRA